MDDAAGQLVGADDFQLLGVGSKGLDILNHILRFIATAVLPSLPLPLFREEDAALLDREQFV